MLEQDNEKSQLEKVEQQNSAAFIMISLKLQPSWWVFFVATAIKSEKQSHFHIVAAITHKMCISSNMAQDWIPNEQALDGLIIKQ